MIWWTSQLRTELQYFFFILSFRRSTALSGNIKKTFNSTDVHIYNGYRTERSPIRSAILRVIKKKNRTTAEGETDLLITSVITDRIGRNEVLLPIHQHCVKFEKETRHRPYVFTKKQQQWTRRNVWQKRAHMTHTAQIGLVTTNHVREFCYSFG